ncbi:hypothetical protein ADL15_45910 [Actinoplanes awajinensis subsp. mycoplanecinus]|uniref:Uncharacterized protein n=2 Tax=Actinoplanes awajinensis TaxID=135946 RepID=A0A117ML75_9ACTN|nr:hypothetical protein ADL15_45910 [Actinoplanes awajinensis subsp. mycoplanecinus]
MLASMEVVSVLILIITSVAVFLTAAVAFWPEAAPRTDAGPGQGSTGDDSHTGPTTPEGTLTRQLLAGEISRPQYRQALTRLAERDDQRHPMSVPESGGSGACP